MIRQLYSYIIISIFSCTWSLGQNFYSTTVDQGLFSNGIECIEIDQHNYLWLGGYGGLQRWDGETGKIFDDKNGLSSSIVYDIFCDQEGELWVGTVDGLYHYLRPSDSFELIDLKGPETPPVNRITQNEEGKLWLATADGLCIYQKDQKAKWIDSLVHSYFDIGFDKDQNVWLVSHDDGIRSFTPKGAPRSILPSAELPSELRCMLIDSQDRLWIGTEHHGIYQMTTEGQIHKHYENLHFTEGKLKPAQNEIKCIYEDKAGDIWAGASDEPLFKLSYNGFQPVSYRSRNQFTSKTHNIFDITEDEEGNTFFASHDFGLLSKNLLNDNFELFLSNIQSNNPDIRYKVTGFQVDPDSTLWVTTEGHGLFGYQSDSIAYHYTEEHGLASNNLMDIETNGNKGFWLASRGAGAFYFDRSSKDSKSISPTNIEILGVDALLLIDSTLWLGTRGQGLVSYDLRTQTYRHRLDGQDSHIAYHKVDWVNDISEGVDGSVWVSSYMGLHHITETTHTEYHPTSPNQLSEYINMTATDQTGTIWIATVDAGLQSIEGSQQPRPSKWNDHLPKDIKGITIGQKNELWLSTAEGIFLIANDQFHHYDRTFGLVTEPVQTSILLSATHSLLIGGTNGFSRIDPHAFPLKAPSPQLQIKEMAFLDADHHPNPFKETEKLNYDQNHIQLQLEKIGHFAPLSFTTEYQLISSTTQPWTKIEVASRSIQFTQLTPGSYQVKTRIKDPVTLKWINGPTTSFVIDAPWWETTLFKLLLLLIVVACTALWFTWRSRQIRKRNVELEQTVKERTAEIREVNEELRDQNALIQEQNEDLQTLNTAYKQHNSKIKANQKRFVFFQRQLRWLIDHMSNNKEVSDTSFEKVSSILKYDSSGESKTSALGACILLSQEAMIQEACFESLASIIEIQTGNGIEQLKNQLRDGLPELLIVDHQNLAAIDFIQSDIAYSHIMTIAVSDSDLSSSINPDHNLTPEQIKDDLSPIVSELITRKQALYNEMRSPVAADGREKAFSLSLQERKFVDAVDDCIKQHISDPELDHTRLETELGLSKTGLYTKMKSITGVGVHEYIRNKRLELSTKFLAQPNASTSQTAYAVGFNSPSYFIRCFTKRYGVSPKEYAKKLT